ncbi:MAG: hypothetical protein L7F78_16505, partial [Syntrophales bacterium LBB04]|nr:hypothetical protein [Syntrophales bacterium LBB04]
MNTNILEIHERSINGFFLILISLVFIASCGNTGEKKKDAQNKPAAANQVSSATPAASIPPAAPAASIPPAATANQSDTSNIAVSVEGTILKKTDMGKDL